jgi:hypothetical protein
MCRILWDTHLSDPFGCPEIMDLWFELVDAGYTEDEAFDLVEMVMGANFGNGICSTMGAKFEDGECSTMGAKYEATWIIW